MSSARLWLLHYYLNLALWILLFQRTLQNRGVSLGLDLVLKDHAYGGEKMYEPLTWLFQRWLMEITLSEQWLMWSVYLLCTCLCMSVVSRGGVRDVSCKRGGNVGSQNLRQQNSRGDLSRCAKLPSWWLISLLREGQICLKKDFPSSMVAALLQLICSFRAVVYNVLFLKVVSWKLPWIKLDIVYTAVG